MNFVVMDGIEGVGKAFIVITLFSFQFAATKWASNGFPNTFK